MKISKYEAFGIALSVGAMALALFLLRVNTAGTTVDDNVNGSEDNVVVAEGQTQQAALGSALSLATSPSTGDIEKMIVNDVVIGDGPEAVEGDTVTVNYIGTLQNGQQFDNSYLKGAPFTFTIGEGKVIAGWEKGIVGMKAGGQRILVVPAELAYGEDGYGPIPKNATLVFAIELDSIK